MTIFKLRYENEIRRFNLTSEDCNLVNLKAFAANFFKIDPRTIVFRGADGNLVNNAQNLITGDVNQIVSLYVEVQPAQAQKDSGTSHHEDITTQTEVKSTDHDTQTVHISADHDTQTARLATDNCSSQTVPVYTSEHQTQTINKPVSQSPVSVQTLPDKTEASLKKAQERIFELEAQVEYLKGELNLAHATIRQNENRPEPADLIKNALNSSAFEKILRESIHNMIPRVVDLVVDEPAKHKQEIKVTKPVNITYEEINKEIKREELEEKHYPAPPLVNSQEKMPEGIQMEEIEEEEYEDASPPPSQISKEQQEQNKTDSGLISSLLSLIHPKTPTPQPENIPEMPELLQQLSDMGFNDKALNEKVLRFHWGFGERDLDAVVTDLLQRQMAL